MLPSVTVPGARVQDGFVLLLLSGLLGCSGPGGSRAPLEEPPRAEWSEPRWSEASVLRLGLAGRGRLEYVSGPYGGKPYLKSLVTPGGLEVLRDAPPDHEHHHGLMLALGVDDVDYWGERYAEVPGRQHGIVQSGSGLGCGGRIGGGWRIERVVWADPRDGAFQLEEWRELHFEPGAQDAPMRVTWWSWLAPAEGRAKVTLWGRPYFGLGLRFAEPFDGAGVFTSSEGAAGVVVRGDERLVSARWCAYSAEVDGRDVTVALFDHPRNPRHPARFFTMAEPFAYLAATLDLAERPLELVHGEALDLCWGLAVWERRASPDEIERECRDWLAGLAEHRKADELLDLERRGE